ncbi:MAG: tail protein X [Zoogloeaceae bacterium]|jgi:phage tail protein X|nr:tail protein X [Zoogloeaceae bacterium]
MSAVVIARQFDTLDLICWRHFGRTAAVTEQALELNPGLARLGAILPEGQAVTLPDVAPTREIKMINLWN